MTLGTDAAGQGEFPLSVLHVPCCCLNVTPFGSSGQQVVDQGWCSCLPTSFSSRDSCWVTMVWVVPCSREVAIFQPSPNLQLPEPLGRYTLLLTDQQATDPGAVSFPLP